MAGLVIDADGHVMEQHQDLFAHIKGNFGEMNWHSTWPMFDADGWQRGLSRKGKREDPDAEAWIRFQNENGIDCAVLYPTSALALGMIQLPGMGFGACARLQRLAAPPLHQPDTAAQRGRFACAAGSKKRRGGASTLRQGTRFLRRIAAVCN